MLPVGQRRFRNAEEVGDIPIGRAQLGQLGGLGNVFGLKLCRPSAFVLFGCHLGFLFAEHHARVISRSKPCSRQRRCGLSG